CTTSRTLSTSPLSLHDALPISRKHWIWWTMMTTSRTYIITGRNKWPMEELKQELEQLFDEMIHKIQLFKKKTYSPAFLEAYQDRSEEHTSELQSRFDLVCRLLV